MISFGNIEVSGFQAAFRGLRNPLESWDRSDSIFRLYAIDDSFIDDKETILKADCIGGAYESITIGPKDMELAQRMILAGDDEAKFMRMIHVQMDIRGPRYWFAEYDTYKVATTANSTSTMHKLASTPITKECFSWDGFEDLELIDPTGSPDTFIDMLINDCEQLRQLYNKTKDKRYWRALIQLLPSSWMQTRTVDLNYQTLRHMYFARRNHKLSEWHEFCDMIRHLPYGKELITIEKGE